MTEEDEFMREGGEIERRTDTRVSVVFFFSRRPSALRPFLQTTVKVSRVQRTEKKGKRASGISVAISSLEPPRNTLRHYYGPFGASWGKWEGYTDGVLDKARPAAKGHPRR